MKKIIQIKEAYMPKKNILLFLLIVFLSSGLISAQTADFDALYMKPGFYEGISEPKPSEAEALLDARNSALRNIASSIASFVTGRYDIKMTSNGTDLHDAIITATGDSSVVFRLPLTGVEEAGKKIEKTKEGYIARILLTLSKAGKLMAEKFVEREKTAYRAYSYFAKKNNLPPLAFTVTPEGYSDYVSWLENNCLIFQMKSSGADNFLNQLDAFFQKLSRSLSINNADYDGKPVRMVYNTPDRFEEIVTALQKNQIKVSGENSRLLLSPDISLEEFKRQVERMPDAGKIIITGINNHDNGSLHISAMALNEAVYAAEQKYGMKAQVTQLPDTCLNSAYDDLQRIKMLNRGNARYVLMIMSSTSLEPGIEAYKILPSYCISYRAILFDSLTEKTFYSDTVKDITVFWSRTAGNGSSDPYSIQLTMNLKKVLGVLENL